MLDVVPMTTVHGLLLCSVTVTASLALGTRSSQVKESKFCTSFAVEQSEAISTATCPALSGFRQPFGFGQLPGLVQVRQYQPFTWKPIW